MSAHHRQRLAYLSGGFDEVMGFVVPELQRRGLFRKDYTGNTLRDHLRLGKASLTPFDHVPAPVGV